ncbi:alpha/beta fold hydrolase [Atopococcus tabaci]|uniref:alpha/beta fold hydrolase n=1 Tax=Atopococcus tabaci TaxID=269774 RepID=UPI0024093B8A|nr:alpha/beta hydrolase [Atopococcus tabaci]
MQARALSIWSNDTFLYARIYGKGRPLLLLHGNGETHQILDAQIRYFSSFRQVIAMDTRGHGKTGAGSGTLTFHRIANDIIRLLDYLNIESIQIIGFSDGGNLALYTAKHYPYRVNEMVIVGANFSPDGMLPKVLKETVWEYRMQRVMGTLIPAIRKKAAVTNLMLDELALRREDLPTIQQPVLVVAGSQDMILESHTHELAKLLPNGRANIVPGASHFLMMENPEEFNRLASDFLN